MKSILKVCKQWCWGLWILVLSSCGQGAQTTPENERRDSSDSTRQLVLIRSRIDSLERVLAKDSLAQGNHENLLDSLGTLCVELANRYQNTPYAPVALWKAARAFRAAGSYPQAIACGKALTETFPQHDLAASALFHNALIFNEDLQNTTSAAFYLDRLLEEYPTDSLASQAQAMKELLGLSEEELNRRLRK